ncbi:elongator complex protein 1, partial [Haematococcus lacustris]
MKNLVLQRDWQRGIALHPDEFVVHCCTCAAEQCLYLATSYCDILRVAADTAEITWRQPLGTVAGGPDSVVTSLTYCLEAEGLSISLSSGELLFLHTAEQQLEEVGVIEGGVAALCWSPDGEVFAAVSGASKLLLMSK